MNADILSGELQRWMINALLAMLIPILSTGALNLVRGIRHWAETSRYQAIRAMTVVVVHALEQTYGQMDGAALKTEAVRKLELIFPHAPAWLIDNTIEAVVMEMKRWTPPYSAKGVSGEAGVSPEEVPRLLADFTDNPAETRHYRDEKTAN